MTYITTFYSHFGAIRYKKLCEKSQIPAQVMPVPRDLSSSCGTCVSSQGNYIMPESPALEEIEQIVEKTESGYRLLYRAANS